jgi:prevent-host-death family protein
MAPVIPIILPDAGTLDKVSAQATRDSLSELINLAHYQQKPTIITRNQKPVAVLVSMDQYDYMVTESQFQESPPHSLAKPTVEQLTEPTKL